MARTRKFRDRDRDESEDSKESVRQELSSENDSSLKESIEDLEKSAKDLKRIEKHMGTIIGKPERGKLGGAIASIAKALVPKSMYELLPANLVNFCAEEGDLLEYVEIRSRENINNTQDALRDLAEEALEKRAELEKLEKDLERADKEGWDAKKLQEYMAARADIKVYKEVADLLAYEFKALSDEEKEARRKDLLNQLRNHVEMGEQLISTMSKVCSGALQIFHKAVSQHAAYLNAYKPMQQIRDAARTLTEMDKIMFSQRDVLAVTFTRSINAIGAAVKLAMQVDKYHIAAGDMKNLLESGRQQISAQLIEYKKAADVSDGQEAKDPVAEIVAEAESEDK